MDYREYLFITWEVNKRIIDDNYINQRQKWGCHHFEYSGNAATVVASAVWHSYYCEALDVDLMQNGVLGAADTDFHPFLGRL